MKKKLLVGLTLTLALTTIGAFKSSAMTLWWGQLYAYNPVYSAPYGEMYVMAGNGRNVYLTCTAAKSGYATRTSSQSFKTVTSEVSVTQSGPTWTASGTSFTGTDRGTDHDGTYHNEVAGPITY